MEGHRLGALALQEIRASNISLPAIEAACRCAAFLLYASDVCLDKAGPPTGSLAPDNTLPIVVHQPQDAPMVWINTYLSASDPRLREAYAQRLLGYAQSSAQDLFACGDFSME